MKSHFSKTARNVIIAILLISALFSIQRFVDSAGETEGRTRFSFLPDSGSIKRFTFGFDSLLCDIYWLRVVQYVGEKDYSKRGFQWLFHSLDLITDLDEKFDTAYYFGGIALTFMPEFVDLSDEILKKGMQRMPDKWRYPWLIGFNNFFYKSDFEKASEYIMQASRIPGSPGYLPFLASKLLARANKPETAFSFLENMYAQTEDPILREKIEERMRRVIVERDLVSLEEAVQMFKEELGRFPATLEELVSKGFITAIPEEPYGGHYYLDSETKRVNSSKVMSRLELFTPKTKQRQRDE